MVCLGSVEDRGKGKHIATAAAGSDTRLEAHTHLETHPGSLRHAFTKCSHTHRETLTNTQSPAGVWRRLSVWQDAGLSVLRGVWPQLPQPLRTVFAVLIWSQGPGREGSQLLYATLIDWLMKKAPGTGATRAESKHSITCCYAFYSDSSTFRESRWLHTFLSAEGK